MRDSFEEDLVSVITPVFNSGRYLGQTIESALNQTYRPIEVVLVDDCSKDNSIEIIKDYSDKFKNVFFYKLPKNSGAAVARNHALGVAKGRYVAFLDSDDHWCPDKLAKQLSLMRSKGCAISYTATKLIDADGQVIKEKVSVLEEADYDLLLKNTLLATSSVIVDRKITGDFKMPLLRSGQDYATWLMLLRGGLKACGINEALVSYRKSKKSLSCNKLSSVQQVWSIQTKYEGISPIRVTFNTVFYVLNAINKNSLPK